MGMPFKLPHMRVISKLLSCCNGGSVTESRHSRYTESNMYSSCTRVELRLFVHVSDVLYRLHVTLVTNTIYGSYQYLQYNEIEPRNGRPVTVSLTRLRPGVQSIHRRSGSSSKRRTELWTKLQFIFKESCINASEIEIKSEG